MSSKTLRQRVARGARLLDEKVPGWERLVKITHLDMDAAYYAPHHLDKCGCVCAQVSYHRNPDVGRDGTRSGVYSLGLEVLGIPWNYSGDSSMAHGFNFYPPETEEGNKPPREWNELWKDEIRRRRG